MPTNGTANKGVETKEVDIVDTILEENCTGGSRCDSVGRASSTHTHTVDETNSYIQVVVQKQRRGRLPAASSPATAAPTRLNTTHEKLYVEAEGCEDGGGGERSGLAEALLWRSRPLLLLPPLALAALAPRHATQEYSQPPSSKKQRGVEVGAGDDPTPPLTQRPPKKCKSWKIFNFDGENLDTSDCGPERFEVYYFESAEAAHLATSGSARLTSVERVASRAQRRAAALLDELLAAARLALAAPVAVLLAVQRCTLEAVRGAVSGVVQTWSDYALKPALALLYNALLHPPLVFASSVARGVRSALRPVFATLGDALEPLGRLLSAVRLVHVHIERAPCHCTRRLPTTEDSNV